MRYTSTRSTQDLASAEAISRGIAADGGLFVPENFPAVSPELAEELVSSSYRERAEKILGTYLTDFTSEEIRSCVKNAYTGTFENEEPAPLRKVSDKMHLLELWHGPTCAFKDLALQLLPHLLTASVSKTSPGKTIVILVATSGDTGKAALEGFADVKDTRIVVFFPRDGVSDMQ
ncbi:MAG: threonine synthase, partial [Lentisphaeria bacterium]|nr:threonine synthase [Lentisphaeria bacterium]